MLLRKTWAKRMDLANTVGLWMLVLAAGLVVFASDVNMAGNKVIRAICTSKFLSDRTASAVGTTA